MDSDSAEARNNQAGVRPGKGLLHFLQRAQRALIEWASPILNPFLARGLRRDARSQLPLRVLAVAVVAVILLAEAWCSWAPDSFAAVNSHYSPLKLPGWCGHNVFGLAALLVAGVSAYVILFRTNIGVARLLKDEADKATLAQLQMLPVPEERWLWQMSAHPWALGLLIAMAGMPVYCLAILADTWSPMDVVGLMLVFVWLAYKAPPWQPMAWMTNANKPAEVRKMRARWRELNRNVDTGSMSAVELMEHNRRMQRAMASGELMASRDATAKEAGIGRGAWRRAGRAATPPRDGFGNRVASGILFYTVVSALSSTFWLSGSIAALAGDVTRWFPASVSELYNSFPLSWPLMMGRLVLAPLPFFAFRVPSVLLLVPLAYQSQRYRNIMLASRVSVADSFWTPRRLRIRRSSARWQLGLWTLMVLGYCWYGLMFNGEISHLIYGTLPDIDSSLAALWTLFLCLASLVVADSCRRHFAQGTRDSGALRKAWRRSTNAIAGTFELAFLGYFVLCWLGGSSGGSALWLARLVPTLGIATAFCLVVLGTEALGATLDAKARRIWQFAIKMWFVLPAAEAVYRELALLGRLGTTIGPVSIFAQAPHLLASPLVNLFGSFRLNLSSGLAWWMMPLAQGTFGCVCLLLAAPVFFADTGTQQVPLAQRLAQLLKAPFVAAYVWIIGVRWAPVMFVIALVRAAARAIWRAGRYLNQRFIYLTSWPQRSALALARCCDNPVLTTELKSMMQGDSWSTQLGFLNVAGIAGMAMAQPWRLRPWDYASTGGTMIGITLGVIAILCVARIFSIGRAFVRDRINGTLVFLFLTPMTDTQILAGKLVPPLVLAAGYWIAAILPMTLGAILLWAGENAQAITWSADALCLTISILVLLACMSLMSAVGHTLLRGSAIITAVILEILAIELECWIADQVNWEPLIVAALTLCLVAINLLAAYGFWRAAWLALARSRYGDVTEQGKGGN